MIKKILLAGFSLCIALSIIIQPEQLYTKQTQPPTLRTGAPGENKCNSCHSGTTNAGNGSVVINFTGPNSKYVPGQIYQVIYTVMQSGITRFGFESTALTPSNTPAGTFTLINTSTTSLQTGTNGRQYVGHKNANANPNISTWTVNWQAPSANVGTVTFYATGVASNANGANSGDNNYFSSITVDCAWGASIDATDVNFSDFKLYQSSINQCQLSCGTIQEGTMNVRMFDLSGREISHWEISAQSQGNFNETLNLPINLNHGIYLFKMQVGNAGIVKKIIL